MCCSRVGVVNIMEVESTRTSSQGRYIMKNDPKRPPHYPSTVRRLTNPVLQYKNQSSHPHPKGYIIHLSYVIVSAMHKNFNFKLDASIYFSFCFFFLSRSGTDKLIQ